ncbi:hypothetical protein PBY51_018297 [Eleginops maclovinus]|uniref:Activator of basal transcription 1 n=1 Tax=Eleginops maclovinus TaxID=56733 RepID=A0AAN7Y740_ELEMC|nr:hypothetical protein PBY51_018297 [Eleginops maclovinus]
MERGEKEERTTTVQREEEEGDDEEEGAAEGAGDEEEVSDSDEEEVSANNEEEVSDDRKCVPGIIYLGHIPPRLRPKHLRNLLSAYGEVGRIFLQPEDGQVRSKKRRGSCRGGSRRCDFTEGWVEFRDKRRAKVVAASLHNTPMGTRKRQRFSSDLWSIKYLHRFQWTHLSERLAFEQTVQQQRLRTEVSQAKRETNFYLNNVDRSAHLDNVRKKRQRDGQQVDERTWDFTQRQTEEEIQMSKRKKKDSVSQKHLDKARLIQQKSQSNVSLLAKIFNSKHQSD